MTIRCVSAGAACGALLLSVGAAQGAVDFTRLGVLQGDAKPAGSFAWGVSADGTAVVGGSYLVIDDPIDGLRTEMRAFRWSAGGGMTHIGTDPGGLAGSSAARVSNDGRTVVGTMGFTVSGAYEARNGQVWKNADDAPEASFVPGSYFASDISANGSRVVGGTREPGPWPVMKQAFYRDGDGATVEIGTIAGGSYSAATAVSADGSVITGFGDNPSHVTAWRWTADTGMVELAGNVDDLPCEARGVSADGKYIVGAIGGQPFRWSESGGYQTLGLLGDSGFGVAMDASADGSAVIGYQEIDGVNTAWLWTQEAGLVSLRDLAVSSGVDLTDWSLAFAAGISDDGRTIVGTAITPDGTPEGFVLTIPAPGSVMLAGFAAVAGLRRRR